MSSAGRLTEEEAAEVLARARAIPVRAGASSIPVQPLQGTTLAGVERHVDPTQGPGRTLLLFLSASCNGCEELFAAAAATAADRFGLEAGDRIVVIAHTTEPPEALGALLGGVDHLLSDTAFADYGVSGAPFFTLIDPGYRTVATEGVAWGVSSVAEAVGAARAGRPQTESTRLHPGSSG